MAASAEDVPQELFDLITSFLIVRFDQNSRDFYERNYVPVNKQELSWCSLVCRRWAMICRPQLFQEVVLSSAEDIYQLVSFLQSPRSVIARYIKTVKISSFKLSTRPWMHLLSLVLFKNLRPDLLSKRLVISIEGPIPRSQRSLRSIHGTLPRSLPPRFCKNISQLTLTDIRFQRFDDLLRLIGELPEMYHMYCKKLSWGQLPENLPIRRAVVEEGTLTVEMSECQNSWPAVWTECGFKRNGELTLLAEELLCVGELARVLESSGVYEETPSSYAHSFLPRGGNHKSFSIHFRDPQNSRRMITPMVTFRPREVNHAGPHAPSDVFLHVGTISIDFKDPKLNVSVAFACDWADFTEVLQQLPYLVRVNVGFANSEDMSRFAEEVASVHMSVLQMSGKLQYAIWDDRKVRWSYAFLDSDARKHTFTNWLWEL